MRVAVPASLDFRDGPRVSDRQGTDHCFDGWQGRATVSGGGTTRTLVLEGSEEARFLIVYIPEDADYFCIEPVTHAVNAMNLPDAAESGLWVLAPRETRQHLDDDPQLDADRLACRDAAQREQSTFTQRGRHL